MRDGGSPSCPGLLPYLPELLVLERRRPTSVILRTPAFLVFFVAQPILAVLLSGSWTISRAWRMTPVYLSRSKGLPYQKLSDLYLLDCAKKRKKLTMKWVA